MLRHEDVAGVTAEVGGQLTDIEETFVWCFSASAGEGSHQPNNWQIPQASTFGVRVDKSSEGSQFSRKASLCSYLEDVCLESANYYSFHASCNPGVSFPCWTQTRTIHSHCWEIKHLNYKLRAGTKRTLTLRVYSDIQTTCVGTGILCDCVCLWLRVSKSITSQQTLVDFVCVCCWFCSQATGLFVELNSLFMESDPLQNCVLGFYNSLENKRANTSGTYHSGRLHKQYFGVLTALNKDSHWCWLNKQAVTWGRPSVAHLHID